MRIRFTIPGRPRGWARATPLPDGRMVTPEWMREHKKETIRIFRAAAPKDWRPFAGPVIARMTAYFEIPVSFSANLKHTCLNGKVHYTGKSDHDNIAKLIGDELNALAWIDDAQLSGGCMKYYGETERLVVDLEFLDDHPITPSQQRRTVKQAQDDLFGGPPKKKRQTRSLNNWKPR